MNSSTDAIKNSIAEYEGQLVQTEMALKNDGDNEMLLNLKRDLKLGIKMYNELLDEAKEENKNSTQVNFKWTVGDSCMATWDGNGKYHPAKITEIGINDTCTVMFDVYQTTQQHDLVSLKPKRAESKTKKRNMVYSSILKNKKRKEDYLVKKAEYEQVREHEKKSWNSFLHKKNKGVIKTSIFKTPTSLRGKVGVGTCQIGGKNMTPVQVQPNNILKRGVVPKKNK